MTPKRPFGAPRRLVLTARQRQGLEDARAVSFDRRVLTARPHGDPK
jgi:hypothetical protein